MENPSGIRIERLESMLVASAYGYGQQPEIIAMEKLAKWAAPKGLLYDPENHRIFGFNNPSPIEEGAEYGYEFWIQVGPDARPVDDIRIQQFNGGLYAVARCHGVEQITDTWIVLFEWVKESAYSIAPHQSLEEHIGTFGSDPEVMTFDLYLAISE